MASRVDSHIIYDIAAGGHDDRSPSDPDFVHNAFLEQVTGGAATLTAHQKYISGSAANFLPVERATSKEIPDLDQSQRLHRIIGVNDDRDSIQPDRYADKADGGFRVRICCGAGRNVDLT